MRHASRIWLLAVTLGLAGCGRTDPYRNPALADAGADGDADADTDADSDTGPEETPSCVVYVDGSSIFGGDGETWATAVDEVGQGITQAVDLLSDFDVCHVWVAEGLYAVYESSVDDTLQLRPGVHVYGGFAGDEAKLSQRDWQDHPTVLSGIELGSGNNKVCHVVTGADDAVLDGFVITGGGCSAQWVSGGGMFNSAASPTVRNCDFVSNSADEGAGMANWDGAAPLVENCGFHDNWCYPGGWGGGLSADNASPTIVDSKFIGNFGSGGSAIMLNESSSEITSCVFAGNTVGDGVCAIDNNHSTSKIVSSVFRDNEGVALHNRQGGFAEISSSIFWGNAGGSVTSDDESGASVEYSLVQGGFPGEGNLDQNPGFASTDSDECKLSQYSPCIDAADGEVAPEHDIVGHARVDDPGAPNTGLGPPWADIGAYEYQL